MRPDLPVVVDFYADWCPPCRMMTPALERLASEFEGRLTIGKIDVDVNQDIAIQYGVMAMPTLALFKGGKMVDRMVGYPGSANPIREWIEKHVPRQPRQKPPRASTRSQPTPSQAAWKSGPCFCGRRTLGT